jgi:hypothetical protein
MNAEQPNKTVVFDGPVPIFSKKTAQRDAARAVANARRLARRRLRHDVRDGRRSVADAITDPCVATLRLAELIAWQYGWPAWRAEHLLAKHEICSPFQVCGKLTDRQRAAVARALRHCGDSRRFDPETAHTGVVECNGGGA